MMNIILTIGFISLVFVGGACSLLRDYTKDIVHENLKEVVKRLVEVEIELKNLRVLLTPSKPNTEDTTEAKSKDTTEAKSEDTTEDTTEDKNEDTTGITTGLKTGIRRKRRYFHMKAKKDYL